jgi:N utilization substance protein A
MLTQLVESFSEFKEIKNIDRATLVRVLEDVFRTLIRKKYGSDDNFDVIVNTDKGDLELWRVREIVADGAVEDEKSQVALTEARKYDASYEVGEECYQQLKLEDFGRRAIMAARQTLMSRILELEKEDVYHRYIDRVGELILGEVSQVLKKELLITDDVTGTELLLPRSEMIRGDFFRKGEMVRAIIRRVELRNNTPHIILSRTDPSFLEKMLEQEVPEIEDGLITIKKVVRMPGERAKIAVESFDDRIDPVGACVGMKGSRIHGIVRELRNENIDIIPFSNNESLFIQRALTPAKVNSVELDAEQKRAYVYLQPDQISLAIGKSGLNIKLASKLTGYEIDVFRVGDDADDFDVELDEFSDEIEQWVIDALKAIGCDTARSVLLIPEEDLVRRTDLEEETISDVIRILKSELEDQ